VKMSIIRGLGRINPSTTALFLCDMQEKFRPMISYFNQVVLNSNRVLHAAKVMDMPVLISEQYPKGLGHTAAEIELEKFNLTAHSKTCFTMCFTDLLEELKSQQPDTRSIILCGIETQACIHHTTLDLLELGYDVHIPVDCASSRSMTDRVFGLQRLRDSGAFLTTSEGLILGLAPDAADPKFRQLQKLVMEPAHETGLVNPNLVKESNEDNGITNQKIMMESSNDSGIVNQKIVVESAHGNQKIMMEQSK